MRSRLIALASALTILTFSCSSTDSASTSTSDRPAATTTTEPAATAEQPGTDSTTTTLTTVAATTTTTTIVPAEQLEMVAFPVPAGSRPHDVAPALDGGVWYTAQGSGELGWLDPVTGEVREIPLGSGSRPHGVIVGPDGAAWVTDSGLDAIVRVEPATDELAVFPLPSGRPNANLNTAAFDLDGRLWFTGQTGVYGVLEPDTGNMELFDAPRGRGPYGIATTPAGDVYYASLAGSYVGALSTDGSVAVLEPPTENQGARRVWADSLNSVWVSEWNSGQLSRLVPATGEWSTWPLPGEDPQAYAVYVDENDSAWVSDFGGNAIHRFDPTTERFDTFALPSTPGNVRQILGRPGEVWGAESAADQLVVIRPIG